jgi:hypothetical protein
MRRLFVRTGYVVLGLALACAAVPLHHAGGVGAHVVSTGPTITAGYYNALPGFDILVSGQHITPLGQADVLILEQGGVRARQVVNVTAQGTFTDKTGLACDFHAQAITAYDQHTGQWSNQAVLAGVCPG